MDRFNQLNLQDINALSITVRLFMATLFGGLIGVERTRKQRAAGFRTHILVCIGATLAMMTNQYLVQEFNALTDPSRIGAQVISGVGFLGAGTILVTKQQEIRGLTTAAGLWASACMGLAIGVGFYEGAIIGFVYIWGVMTVLQRVDRMVYKRPKHIQLYLEIESLDYFEPIMDYLKATYHKKYEVQILNKTAEQTTEESTEQPKEEMPIGFIIKFRMSYRQNKHELIKNLKHLEGIRTIREL